MAPSTRSTPRNGDDTSQTIDLTEGADQNPSTPSSMKRPHSHHHHHHHRSQPSFTSAYHRILSRHDRRIDRSNPNLIRERIDIAEERRDHPARERALNHVSRAYAAVGYTHAFLAVIVSLLFAALLLAVARAVASDVSRKTRDRAADFLASAAECSASIRQNNCIVDGDHVSHRSYEMAALCKKWVSCARRGKYADSDARSAKVWAETLADIVNTFTERLSTTTILVTALLLFVVACLFSSTAFNFLHRRVVDENSFLIAQPHQPVPPMIQQPHPERSHVSPRRTITFGGDSHSSPRR